MKRYLITFSYDGTNFYGFQKQKDFRSVQDEIEKVLSRINNKKVRICGSGRTDNKVHAINQKAHFDFSKEIELNKFKKAINSYLPKDIFVKELEEVDKFFHARFDVKKKKYLYILNTKDYNVFENNYVYQYNKDLNIIKMKDAIKLFEGKHDFKAFKSFENKNKDNIRTIFETKLLYNNGKIYITFIADGFLKYQVRNMIGVLIEIGQETEDCDIILSMLKTKNKLCSNIANPEGLYLEDVYY